MRNSIIIQNKHVKSGFKVVKRIGLPLFLVAITTFCGCFYFNRGRVYKDWTKTMSELGIFPVFPPREDVQVGDVWILPMHPFETSVIEKIGGLGHTGIWCDNIFVSGTTTFSLRNTVNEFYKTRPSFPSTINASASILYAMQTGSTSASADNKKNGDGIMIMGVPRSLGTASVFTQESNDVFRLRQVAFPEFAFTKIDKGSLNVLVPVEYIINLAGGFTYDKVRQISLKIPSAESYGCPPRILLEQFFKNQSIIEDNNGNLWLKEWDFDWENPEKGTEAGKQKQEINIPGIRGLNKSTARLARAQFNEAFQKLAESHTIKYKHVMKSNNFIWVAVITEVFYARAIDINISTKKGWGGGLNVQPITNQMLAELDRLKHILSVKKTITKKSSKALSGTTNSGTTGPSAAGNGTTGSGANSSSTVSKNIPDTKGRDIAETIELEKSDDVFELAKKINKYNADLGKQLVPGGSVNIVSASESYVGLRRIFDRPIAVGVRGVIMRIDIIKSEKGKLWIDIYAGK